jgi:tetratricopeptide (TPR) repeat protein
MSRKLKQVLTAFTAVLMITSFTTVFSFAKQGNQSPEVADTLFNILADTRNEVDALFEDITQNGGTIPDEALESYEEALILWEEAETSYDEGDYEEAADKATEALNEFGEAAEEASEDDGEELEVEENEETENAIGLSVKHEKMMRRLEKLRAVVTNLEFNGLDVTDIFSLLDQIEALLSEAEVMLDEGDFEEAEEALEVAKELIGKATGFVHSTSNMIQKDKTEKFIEKTIMRLMNLERNVNRILARKGVSQEEMDEISGLFGILAEQLGTLDQVLSEESLEEVVDELDDLVEEADDIIDEEDDLDEDVTDALKDLDKLWYKVSEYKMEIGELADVGEDVTVQADMLNSVESLLEAAYIELGDDDHEAAQDKIEEAENILNELDELIEDSEEHADEVDDEDDHESGSNEDPDVVDVEDNTAETGEEADTNGDEDIFTEEKAELVEELEGIKQIIDGLTENEIDTSSLEDLIDEIETALEEADGFEDLELTEQLMEDLENIIKEEYAVALDEN